MIEVGIRWKSIGPMGDCHRASAHHSSNLKWHCRVDAAACAKAIEEQRTIVEASLANIRMSCASGWPKVVAE
eukprot:2541873-Amphidinium_carterae.2